MIRGPRFRQFAMFGPGKLYSSISIYSYIYSIYSIYTSYLVIFYYIIYVYVSQTDNSDLQCY